MLFAPQSSAISNTVFSYVLHLRDKLAKLWLHSHLYVCSSQYYDLLISLPIRPSLLEQKANQSFQRRESFALFLMSNEESIPFCLSSFVFYLQESLVQTGRK